MIQIQKELLDAEMELFTSQQDGSDSTAEIQQKVTFFLNLERFFFQCSLTVWSLQDEGVGGVRSFPLSYIILILILSYSDTQIIEKTAGVGRILQLGRKVGRSEVSRGDIYV